MRLCLIPLAGLLSACGPQEPPATKFRATGETLAFSGGDGGPTHACATCHGLRGEGDGRLTPRLAGLDAGYLHRQLDDYANGRREHAPMRDVAIHLTNDDRTKLAAYYAALPAASVPSTSGSTQGATIYARECASCHGANGEGGGPGNPPLVGQSADYIEAQLKLWREGKRRGDGMGEMLAVSRRLAPEALPLVARHAAGFPAARPRGVPATSP